MLVYDGDCGFCVAAISLLRRWFEPRAPSEAWQVADLDELGLTEEACREAVHWVSGSRHESGADAVAAWLRTSRRLQPVIALTPILLPLGRRLYPVVARNRSTLSRVLRIR